jgi:hypothetical protein
VVHSGFGCEGMAERNHTEMVPGLDMINLTGIVLYKVGNILFFLVPYIALRIVK